jgi:hypothetical protein
MAYISTENFLVVKGAAKEYALRCSEIGGYWKKGADIHVFMVGGWEMILEGADFQEFRQVFNEYLDQTKTVKLPDLISDLSH